MEFGTLPERQKKKRRKRENGGLIRETGGYSRGYKWGQKLASRPVNLIDSNLTKNAIKEAFKSLTKNAIKEAFNSISSASFLYEFLNIFL